MSLENLYKQIFYRSSTGSILLSSDCKVADWNRWMEENSGISRNEAIGQELGEIFPSLPKRLHSQIQSALANSLSSILSNAFENAIFPFRSEELCSVMPQSVSISPIRHLPEEKYCLIEIRDNSRSARREDTLRRQAVEITRQSVEIEEANCQLHEKIQELDQFVFIAGHDLKAPLRAIIGLSQVILEDSSEVLPELSAYHLEVMRTAATTMSNLIEDLLNLSRTANCMLELKAHSLAVCVRQSIEHLGDSIDRDRIEFDFNSSPILNCDLALITILLQNLLSNAHKFSDPRSPIQISYELEQDCCVIGIKDQGHGIPNEKKDDIFNAFTRIQDAHATPGSGLGLAICARIAERHNHKIWVEENEDKGCTFKFRLALAPKSTPETAAQKTSFA